MKSCQHVAATHAQHACLSFGPVLYPLCPWTPRGCAIEFEFGGLVAVFAQRQDGIVAVPLFMSTDLRYVPAASKEILLNPGLLQIRSRRMRWAGPAIVSSRSGWMQELHYGDMAVALHNGGGNCTGPTWDNRLRLPVSPLTEEDASKKTTVKINRKNRVHQFHN